MISKKGQKFLSVSGELVIITYVSPHENGFSHYGEIENKRYDYTKEGKCFAVMGRSNKAHYLERELTPEKDPEYFL